ncbi:DUF4249 domain-containing protein [Flavobacterium sp. Root420]|uniref:DUF4249 domain-containing protein n=1 Tax=Flavobacterium sp. Root420 TaxID=1736533 RepID=UPI0006F993DF|nr:DUF4249 domain-containing protein [Flavobacterium sp. Root420]KQW99083.1 hypothetical protein ASC72_12720 [Flavobacterium sp. Root420]
MQRINKYTFKNKALALLSLIFVLFFSSCEDVVQLDLETGQTKLVIDAEIIWQKGTAGNEQVIKVSKTAPYYNNTTPKVSGAQVKIENSNGDVFTFNETEPGSYVCNNFVPVLNMDYTLSVATEGQTFRAVEKLTAVAPIDRVEQETVKDAVGDEFIEIVFYYKDPADQVNYYLTDFKSNYLLFPEYDLTRDEFFNGNEMDTRFTDDDKIKPGITYNITHRGISKNFYNYMNLILEIYGGSPFSIPPGNIRGNIINTSDPNNFAFGYFRLCEADKVSYVVK